LKILITGATGLVGSRISQFLINRGHKVNFLTTRLSKTKNSKNVKGFFWNPKSGEIDKNCLEGVSTIINLAGASVAKRWTASHKASILNSRLDTLNLLHSTLEKSAGHKVEQLISASAIGVYPHSFKKLYEESETTLNDGFLGDVVQQWEKYADKFETLGLRVAKIRIGIVLSKNGGALEKMAKPIKSYVGAPLGSGKQWQSWIHIDDLADLFLFINEKKLAGVYNGVAPNPVTNSRLTKDIARKLRKPILLPPVPGFMLKLILGEMARIVLSSQKVSSEKIENEGFRFEFKDVYDALSDIYD
jgi:hypothetical protein